MTREEIKITVLLSEIQELIRLITKIEIPDVTYDEDMLMMAQQALRLNKMRASDASNILYRWARGADNAEQKKR